MESPHMVHTIGYIHFANVFVCYVYVIKAQGLHMEPIRVKVHGESRVYALCSGSFKTDTTFIRVILKKIIDPMDMV
jgi:hypothetical protein